MKKLLLNNLFAAKINASRMMYAVALVLLFLSSSVSFGQTVVTLGGGASVTCPATPTATWTTPPTGVTFSNWSRGSGVTCGSAANGLSGSTFSSASAAAAFTANKYYSVTITAAATHNFTLSSIVWATAVSSGSCNFDVQYSNNGGTVTSFGTQGTSTFSNTFTGSVNVAAGTSIVLYLIPSSATSGSTVRWVNGSTITVTATAAGTTRTSNAVTGNWTSGSSWVGGTAPVAGDNVVIVSGANITFDANATRNSGTTTTVNSGGTLTLGASYTNSGTTTVNGTLQVNGGGYASGTAFTYAATGSALVMNHNSGLYGISTGQAFWPTTLPPFDVTIQGTGAQINNTVGNIAGTLTVNSQLNCAVASAFTVNGTLNVNAQMNNSVAGAVTVSTSGTANLAAQLNNTVSGAFVSNGILKINAGGYVSTNSPTYGASSNLTYNTSTYTTTDIEFPPTGVVNVTITAPTGNNTVTLNTDKTITGALTVGTHTVNGGKSISAATMTIGTGSIVAGNLTASTSLVCSGASNISVSGNWSVASFTKSTSTVTFNGTGNYNNSTLFYNLTNSSGTRSITQNMDVENTLAITGGQMGVTGGTARTLTMSGAAATINIAGGSMFGTDAGTNNDLSLVISGTQTTLTGNATGSNDDEKKFFNVTVNASRTLILSRGILCKYGTFTVNGTLQINANGYIQTGVASFKTPVYGNASLLKYNVGATYGRGGEWTAASGTIGTTAGYPNDIQVSNNTTLNIPNTGNSGTDPSTTSLGLNRDFTIDSGSSAYMDYGASSNKSGSLTVGRNITISGSFSLGDAVGGDLNVAGNFARTGTFTTNGRAVQFNGSSAQTLTGATTFAYLTLGGNGGVTLQSSSSITVNNTLTLGSGGSTGKLTLGANTLTIAAAGSISGASSSSFIVTDNAASVLKRNSVSASTLFPVGNLSSSYTPLTITNTGTTNDLSVASSATIDNAVTDSSKIVTLQWTVTSGGSGAVGNIVFNWNSGNQAGSYNATGTGELGVYTTGPYAITSLGTMAGQTKTVNGVALASGTNKMVVGNTGAVYAPPPANDECSGAVSLTVGAAAIAGNNLSATKSSPTGLTASAYTLGTAKDMWYTFTPTCSGSHTITLAPTAFDGAMALFTGGTCPNPTYTTFIDAVGSGSNETINFTATAGVTYRVLVWGYNSSAGSFTIAVTSSVTPNFALANTGSPATGNVSSNTNNAVLYGFALNPTACTNSFDFTAASITTSGTATTSDLSNFRLIVDANSNGVADSGEIAAPIGTVSTLANPLAFTVTGQTGLTAVTRYLLIADVAPGATGGNTFAASMVAANITATSPVTVSGTATGNTQTITAAAIAIADNTQVTTASIFRGSTNNIISKAQLTVSGQNTSVTAMNFVTAGVSGGYTSADITASGFKLWVSTTNTFGSATQVGSGVSSAKATATNTETISFTTTQNLTVGTTYYYWLTVDVAAAATVNRTITVNGLTNASVVSAGTTVTGTTTASGVQTIIAPTLVIANNTTVPTGNVLVGSTSNIVARAQFTVTNATVALSAMSYVTASNASGYTSADIATGGFKLWVNTTNTFSGATQVGTSQNSTKVTAASTETITFTAAQNLTAGVYYYWLTADIASAATPAKVIIVNGLSSASLTSSTTGVALSGTSSTSGTQTIVAPTLTIANNTQVTTQNLFANSTNNIVSKAQVTPTNDNVSASAISFVTAGNATGYTSADIATGGFKLWVNTTNTFSGATQVGSGQSSTKTTATNTETITFTATQNFTVGTTYYYWLTADIASGATVGNILVVNGLTNTSITATTANAVVTGSTSATGNQTIVVPTVTLANTGTPAAGSIAVGANNVVLFGFGLTPNTSVDFTAANITTSGTATTSDLSNFRLVYDANSNGIADSGEITSAIGTVSTLSGTLAFTGITGQTAFSALRRYLLIADAASGATSGRTFTANLTAANITTTATTNTGSAAGNTQTLVYIVSAGDIVINQLNQGYNGASDEYIELVNKTGKAFDLSTLKINYYSAAGGLNASTVGTLSGTLQPYSFWLLATATSPTVTVGATTSLAADDTFTGGMAAAGGQISLQRVSDNVQIDGVAYGTVSSNVIGEGTAATASASAPSSSVKRTIDGNDSNSNSADFSTVANASIYLRNSTGRLANSGATIASGSYRDLSVTGNSSIGGNVSVSSQIRLDNNGILATNANVLTLTSTGSVSRVSGWVNGNFKKNIATGATNKTFEIGGNTFYRPVTLAFTSVTTAGDLTATVTTTAGDYPGIAASGIDASKSVNRYWTLTNSGIVFTNFGATFTFDASDVDGGATTSNFIMRNYDGSWATSTAGTRTATTTQATGITTFGDFVIGESTGAPTVASNPSTISTCPSIAASFSSTTTSVPTPTVNWERGISGTYTTITSLLDGGVYSNFNTTTLNISSTAGLNGYTYRVVYANINGTVTSTAATLTTGTTKTYSGSWSPSAPTSIDAAVISSDYNAAADINACSLTVTSGNVIIPSGNNVTLSGALDVSSGSFTLSNNANLIQTGTNYSNTGNIIVKRNSAALNRLDYTLWSSPVSGQGLYAFSPFTFANRFYVYNPSTDAYNAFGGFNISGLNADGVNGTDGNNAQFATGTGYLIRVPWNHPTAPTVWEGTFTGVPHTGDVTLSGLTSGKYYAIGNPYPSTIDADQFIIDNSIGDNPLTPGDGLYFWRKTNNSAMSSYATYTTAGGVKSGGDTLNIVPNGTIQVGQGFIVKTTSTSLVFNNGQRIADNQNQFLKTSTIERNRIWLNLSDSATIVNQMMVAYMTGATQNIDAAIDGRYFKDSTTALNSLLNNEEFAIQGRSLPFESSDVVPLTFKTATAGNYSIAIDHVDGLFSDGSQPIYIKDNLNGTEHNLNTGAYTFASAAGTFNERFEIIYQSQLGVENPTFNANNVIIYSQNNGFAVTSGTTNMASIKVFDVRGRMIEEKKGINSNHTTISGGLSNQVLLVQITSEDGIIVTKKVIR